MSVETEGVARFTRKDFLLERSWQAIKQRISDSRGGIRRFVVSFCLFGGFLGVTWTLANLHPEGDLSLYLIPFLLLAIPVGMLSPHRSRWQKLVSLSFVLVFWAMLCWGAVWYFLHFEWGYRFRWLFMAGVLVCVLTWATWRREHQEWHGIGEGILVSVWLSGVILTLLLVGFLAFYIGRQIQPEPTTSNILTGSTFIFFLALTLLRFYWFDSSRNYRAERITLDAPDDVTLLLEWFIPRSYSFLLILFFLMVAEAMMFSTIFRTMQQGPVAKYNREIRGQWGRPVPLQAPTSQRTKIVVAPSSGSLRGKEPVAIPSSEQASSKLATVASGKQPYLPSVNNWFFFAIKPYVFPKHEGREIDAPTWFKYLGRILLGLIFAILLTQQLNIWRQFQAMFLSLWGCVQAQQRGEDDPLLERQRQESLETAKAMLNAHSPFWRGQVFAASSVPTLWLRWRLVLAVGRFVQDGALSLRRFLTDFWGITLMFCGAVLFLLCTPFAAIYGLDVETWLACFVPALASGLLLFILRKALNLHPPKVYQFWIWWLLVLHFLVAALLFFLILSVGLRLSFWQSLLWYVELATVLVFPLLFIAGGERYKRSRSLSDKASDVYNDSDHVARKMVLDTFFLLEHRQWLIAKLTHYIHPVRSSVIKLRLILPSVRYQVTKRVLAVVQAIADWNARVLRSFHRAIFTLMLWHWVAFVIVFVWHLVMYHRLFPRAIFLNYLVTLGCLVAPSFLLLTLWMIVRWGKGFATHSLSPRFVLWMQWTGVFSTSASVLCWMIWMDFQIEVNTFGVGLLAWLLTYPWLAHFSLHKGEQAYAQTIEGAEQDARFWGKTMDSLQKAADQQERKKEEHLENIYSYMENLGPTDPDMRDQMIRGCARLLEEAYRALQTGRWYKEDEHALDRVYREWLMGTGEAAEIDEAQQVADELAIYTEQIVDTLSALLYDINTPERRDHLRFPPESCLVLSSLARIVALPRTILPKRPSDWPPAHKALWQSLEALRDLLNILLKRWGDEPVKRRERALALQILAAMESDSAEELIRRCLRHESEPRERLMLLEAMCHSSRFADVFTSLLSSPSTPKSERELALQGLLLYELPTPIAMRYQHFLQQQQLFSEAEQRLIAVEQSSINDDVLSSYQGIRRLRDERRLRAAIASKLQQQRKYQQSMRSLQLGIFGFLLNAMRELWGHELPSLRAMHWDNAQALSRIARLLQEHSSHDHRFERLRHLFLELYAPSPVEQLERSHLEVDEINELELWFRDVMELLWEALEHIPVLGWSLQREVFRTFSARMSEWEPVQKSPVFVRLRGAKPDFRAAKIPDPQQTPLLWLGHGVTLPMCSLPRLDIWSSVWALKWLRALVNSEELLDELEQTSEGDAQVNTVASKFTQVRELALRIGQSLGPYTPEERRRVTRYIAAIDERLKRLQERPQGLVGKGIVDFVATFHQLESFLNKREEQAIQRTLNLLHINLLPDTCFRFLLESHTTTEGELRTYLDVATERTQVVIATSDVTEQIMKEPSGMRHDSIVNGEAQLSPLNASLASIELELDRSSGTMPRP